MKKVMFAMAVMGMFSFAACNNCKKTEEPAEPVVAETVENAVEEAETTVENVASDVVEAAADAVSEVVAE